MGWLKSAVVVSALVMSSSLAEASPVKKDRGPVSPDDLRASSISFDRYNTPIEVARERSAGKEYATFVADPQLIEKNAVVSFEIRSVASAGSVVRWRCIAVHDVAECLGAPVRVRYLPEDQRIVLTTKVEPRVAQGALVASR